MIKCFGSKLRAARNGSLPAPKFRQICEPFAGGAGYSLTHADRDVWLNDWDPQLRVLWPWLIGPATESEIRGLPVDLPYGLDIRTLNLPEPAALLIKWNQRTRNNGGCWTVSQRNGTPGYWCARTRDRIAEQCQAIKHWRFDPTGCTVQGATYLIDPPYQHNYRYGLPPINYDDLGEVCTMLADKGFQVIACEAPHPRTGEFPTWLPFREAYEVRTHRPAIRPKAKELLWLS